MNKPLLATFLKYIIVILILISFFNISRTRSRISSNFSKEDLMSIKIGMTIEEVTEILGLPFTVDIISGFTHDLNCKSLNNSAIINSKVTSDTNIKALANKIFSRNEFCCEANFEERFHKAITTQYTKPIFFSRYYPELWIHYDTTFRVNSVFSKRYEGNIGGDFKVIYSLTKDKTFSDEKLIKECF